jgi:hypothetical protein
VNFREKTAICQVSASIYDSRLLVGHASRQMEHTGQKHSRSEISFARPNKSADVKSDLHFRRNGTSHTPLQSECRQFGKLATAATISKKHVARRDRRVCSCENVVATSSSSHLLITTNRVTQDQTYISVGMVPSRLSPSARYVNLVSAALPQPSPRFLSEEATKRHDKQCCGTHNSE